MSSKSMSVYFSISAILTVTLASNLSAKSSGEDSLDYVMTDFNNRQQTTPFNGYWYIYNDNKEKSFADSLVNGNSSITSFDSSGYAFVDSVGYPDARTFPNDRKGADTYCLKFGFKLGDRKLACGGTCNYAPHVGFGTGFTTMADTLDLTGSKGISFWAKADFTPLVVSVSVPITDTGAATAAYAQRFSLDTTWKMYTIKLIPSADFAQPSYSAKSPFVISRVKGMAFSINAGDNAKYPVNAMYVDDVTILKWKYVDPYEEVVSNRMAQKSQMAKSWISIIRISENQVEIALPSVYTGRSGKIEAVDVKGKILAQATFAAERSNNQIDLTLPEARALGWHFRISETK
jgi:hypothetical protein